MLTAKIDWFDATSGEGRVTVIESGECLYLHFTALAGISKNNYHWPTLDDQSRLSDLEGQTGPVTIYRNLYSAQVESLVLECLSK